MIKQSKKKVIILSVSIVLLVVVIGVLVNYISSSEPEPEKQELKKFDDVRYFLDSRHANKLDISNWNLAAQENIDEVLPMVRFNEDTKWPSGDNMPKGFNPKKVLEKAKNPGLGIKNLHKKGIDGEGVSIGVIDQPIYTTHPEYADRIIEYKEFGESDIKGSSLGAGTMSILAGKDCGVAPKSSIYYAAVAAEKLDVYFYSEAVKWFIELNNGLKDSEKIRIIVVSVRLDGDDSPYTENNGLWEEALKKAKEAGIIVYDCSTRNQYGACYLDSSDVNNVKKARPGYPADETKDSSSKKVLLPISPRTVAEEYEEGLCKYQYVPSSAIVWTPPYAAGLAALAIQAGDYRDLSEEEIFNTMYETSYVRKDGLKEYHIVQPSKFIETIKSR